MSVFLIFDLRLAIDRTREVNGLGYAAIRSVAGNQALQPRSRNFESQRFQ